MIDIFDSVLDFPSTYKTKRVAKEYGYDEFIIRRWFGIFGEEEALKLINAMENIPKYIRVNTIKIDKNSLFDRLSERGFKFKKTEIDYCYEVVEEPYSIGATPEYLMGYYYIMDKSSCIPPIVLFEDRCTNRHIIADFAASPGGKATMLSQLLRKSVILALEPQNERIQPLIDNIHRMGATNIIVLKMDARDFPNYGISVDAVLLDAPCSGEGIIHKDKSRKKSRGKKDILFCSKLQRELLKAAILSVKSGIIVYSTCSLTPEENEFVIQWAINNFDFVEIEKIKIPGEKALTEVADFSFDSRMRFARRYYPHKNRCSGFFVAKLKVYNRGL